MDRKPIIPSQAVAIGLGVAFVGLGFVLLYDAFEGRGLRKPWPLGPFLPW